MKYKLVIFDMDGVIVDTEPHQLERFVRFVNEKSDHTIEEKDLIQIVGMHSRMCWNEMSIYFDETWDYDRYINSITEFYKDEPLDFKAIYNEHMTDLIAWLKQNNFKTALASSGSVQKIKSVLKSCNLETAFDLVLSGDMFEKSKPHPEIYITVSEKLGVDPMECIVIEDSPYGIEASKAAGMFTIALREERFNFEQKEADLLVNSLGDMKEVITEMIN